MRAACSRSTHAGTRPSPAPPSPRRALRCRRVSRLRASPPTGRRRRRGQRRGRTGSCGVSRGGGGAQHGQDVVAGAHGVVIGLSGGTLLVGVLVVLPIEDPVPGAMPVVDEMAPGVLPGAFVPGPVTRVPGGGMQ